MKRLPPLPLLLTSRPSRAYAARTLPWTCSQCIHTSARRSANPLPLTATGPPPSAPLPAASQHGERVDRRRRQAELVKRGQELRGAQTNPGSAMKKRFWKDVHIKRDKEKNHIVHLDSRPVRNPTTRAPLLIPASKPHLATAVALEWDNLTSAQQALRTHLIPLTSIASRAQSLALEDAQNISDLRPEGGGAWGEVLGGKGEGIRYEIVNTLLRYLDTDTLLCWAPPSAEAGAGASVHFPPPSRSNSSSTNSASNDAESLRNLQIRTATPILAYLTQYLWPGVELRPALDTGSILPRSQPPATRAVIKGWLSGLPAWELVGLERAVLAGKSLCVGARLIGEWGESLRISQVDDKSSNTDLGGEGISAKDQGQGKRFGIEEATEASSLEVRWQTGQWGEVEDSHDVEKEDLARQFGSAILVAGGSG